VSRPNGNTRYLNPTVLMEDDILFCVGVSKLFWIFRTAATWFLVIGIVYLPDAVSLPSRTIWLKAYDEQRGSANERRCPCSLVLNRRTNCTRRKHKPTIRDVSRYLWWALVEMRLDSRVSDIYSGQRERREKASALGEQRGTNVSTANWASEGYSPSWGESSQQQARQQQQRL
jgi:hypothetical protein